MPVTGSGIATKGLGGAQDYGEIEVPRSDDGALQVDVGAVFESGLNFFGTTYAGNALFINTNGVVSFGQAFTAYPTASNEIPGRDLLAPFWGDVDTRLDGEAPESGAIWVDIDPVADVVSVTWQEVGVYRRNSDVPNTFQLQLADRGNGDFDIIFRYQQIGWTIGTGEGDAGARVGFYQADGQNPVRVAVGESHSGLEGLPGILGNTGTPGLWLYEMRGGTLEDFGNGGRTRWGSGGNDTLTGTGFDDMLDGLAGNDRLDAGEGNDTLQGGEGTDTLIGGAGNDVIWGGASQNDRRDVIYAGTGNDRIDGGYGNDELRGDAGADTITGGFGADTVVGGAGDDNLNGHALSDLVFGGDGNDFVNGGFGHDRVNGGAGADVFFHLGIFDHGSDWIQDYRAREGDVLLFGNGSATREQFQVNFTDTPGAGMTGIDEAFVIYRPTGQIMWALVDGGAQSSINLQIGADVFDLLV